MDYKSIGFSPAKHVLSFDEGTPISQQWQGMVRHPERMRGICETFLASVEMTLSCSLRLCAGYSISVAALPRWVFGGEYLFTGNREELNLSAFTSRSRRAEVFHRGRLSCLTPRMLPGVFRINS